MLEPLLNEVAGCRRPTLLTLESSTDGFLWILRNFIEYLFRLTSAKGSFCRVNLKSWNRSKNIPKFVTVSLFTLKINSVDESSIEQVIYFFTNKNTKSQEYLAKQNFEKKEDETIRLNAKGWNHWLIFFGRKNLRGSKESFFLQ